MVKKYVVLFSVAAVLLSVCAVSYWLIGREKRAVKAMLTEAVELVCRREGEVFNVEMLKFARVDKLFAPQIAMVCSSPDFKRTFQRDDLKNALLLFYRNSEKIDIRLADIAVEVTDDGAVFFCDMMADVRLNIRGRDFHDVYSVTGSAVKEDGRWKISSLVIEPVVRQ